MAKIDAPIKSVTLLEDRAQVKRCTKVKVKKGRNKFSVEEVSPVICDKTLLVRANDEAVKVNDSRVKREYKILREDMPEEAAALKEKIDVLARESEGLEDESERVSERLDLYERVLERTLNDIAVDAAWGRKPDKSLADKLGEMEGEVAKALRSSLELSHKQEKLSEKENDLQIQYSAKLTPSSKRGADIELELIADEDKEVELTIEYLVPGAVWRPRHRARLEGDEVHFETEGCVWQNTGEPWEDVQLYFSTERPSLGSEVPLLQSDLLRKKDKPKEEVVEIRQQNIETTGLGRAGGKKQAPELPGIDDAGEVQHLKGAAKSTIPSNGRPFRVPLFGFKAEVKPGLRLLPELSSSVYVRTEQANKGTHPVLAGPVDLIRNGGFVGRSKVLYIAPEEEFELGWGPDPYLRAHRFSQQDEKERGLLSNWNTIEYTVIIKLSNVGPTDKKLEVQERIPVSEVDKVVVNFDKEKTKGAPKGPDDDGIVKWDVTLPPFGHETLVLHYTIEKHKDIKGL